MIETDIFLTHDWGTDEQGRNNHERVSFINDVLKKEGYITWFDSDRMTGDVARQIADGIDNTKVVIVFMTQRYHDKVSNNLI